MELNKWVRSQVITTLVMAIPNFGYTIKKIEIIILDIF